MNEEEIRLLQAAITSLVDELKDAATTESAAQIKICEILTKDRKTSAEDGKNLAEDGEIPPEDVEKLLVQLQQEGLSQSDFAHLTDNLPTTETSIAAITENVPDRETNKFHLDQALYDKLTEVLGQGKGVCESSSADTSSSAALHVEHKNCATQQHANYSEGYSQPPTRTRSIHSNASSPTPSPHAYRSAHPASPLTEAACQYQISYRNGALENLHRSLSYSAENGDQRNFESLGIESQNSAGEDDPLKSAEKERVREENRERKKRWREVNQDRNKDNDLRCRVTKRATRLFGPQSSPARSAWINSEFQKRKQKRELKEKSRFDGPRVNGSSSVFASSAHGYRPQYALAGMTGTNDTRIVGQADMSRTVDDATSSETQPVIDMPSLIQLIMSYPPELVTELHKFASDISGIEVPLVRSNVPWPVEQSHQHPAPENNVISEPPPALANNESGLFQGLLQGLVAGGDFPEGFELLLAELAEKPKEGQKAEYPAVATQTPEDLDIDLDEENLDELLAALKAADTRASVEKDVANDVLHTDHLAEINALLGSETFENPNFVMTEEALERVINDGDLTNISLAGLTKEDVTSGVDLQSSIVSHPSGLEFRADDFEAITADEINQLLGELNQETEALMTNNAPTQPQNALTEPNVDPQPAEEKSPTTYTTSNDPDTSAQYTPETVAAILRVILENTKVPPPKPQQEITRSIKRLSPSSYGPPVAKRSRGLSPLPSAVNQLNGILQTSATGLRPLCAFTPSVSAAYATSYSNSDEMNKRLMAMKPPPYRPGGVSSGSSTNGISLPNPVGISIPQMAPLPKRKSGEDEKKIKAMGFPPLMAGIKPKTE